MPYMNISLKMQKKSKLVLFCYIGFVVLRVSDAFMFNSTKLIEPIPYVLNTK